MGAEFNCHLPKVFPTPYLFMYVFPHRASEKQNDPPSAILSVPQRQSQQELTLRLKYLNLPYRQNAFVLYPFQLLIWPSTWPDQPHFPSVTSAIIWVSDSHVHSQQSFTTSTYLSQTVAQPVSIPIFSCQNPFLFSKPRLPSQTPHLSLLSPLSASDLTLEDFRAGDIQARQLLPERIPSQAVKIQFNI